MPPKNPKKQSVAQKERARKAVELKIAGATWAQIAEEIGMETEAGARLLVSRYFELTAKSQFEEMRPIVLERAEVLWRRAFQKLNQIQQENGPVEDWDKAMRQCVNVLQQLARISGLGNGPTVQINVTSADDVRSLRDEFYELRGIEPPVIDGEVIDGDQHDTTSPNGLGHNGIGI